RHRRDDEQGDSDECRARLKMRPVNFKLLEQRIDDEEQAPRREIDLEPERQMATEQGFEIEKNAEDEPERGDIGHAREHLEGNHVESEPNDEEAEESRQHSEKADLQGRQGSLFENATQGRPDSHGGQQRHERIEEMEIEEMKSHVALPRGRRHPIWRL